MVPLTLMLPTVAPPSQLCPSCPPSRVGSASSGGFCVGSRQAKAGGSELGTSTGVHGNVGGGATCASSRFDLVKCGATCGSGRHELAMTGSGSGEQRLK